MKIEEAISILEKELNCQEAEEKYCKQWITCSSCPYDFDEDDDLSVAIKVIIGLLDDDLIRRQDALDCFHAWMDSRGDAHEPDEMPEYRAIENLPSVLEDEE